MAQWTTIPHVPSFGPFVPVHTNRSLFCRSFGPLWTVDYQSPLRVYALSDTQVTNYDTAYERLTRRAILLAMTTSPAPPPERTYPLATHGNFKPGMSGYTQGCRCQRCSTTKAAYDAKRYQRNRSKIAAQKREAYHRKRSSSSLISATDRVLVILDRLTPEQQAEVFKRLRLEFPIVFAAVDAHLSTTPRSSTTTPSPTIPPTSS